MSEELEAEEFPEDFVKFPTRTIEKIFRLVWKESSTRISGDALKASAELLRLFVKEAHLRAARVANSEGATSIEPLHLEKVMVQLLLDF